MGVWPRSAGAASVLVWNVTPWGDAIRTANAIPLLFSSFKLIRLIVIIRKKITKIYFQIALLMFAHPSG